MDGEAGLGGKWDIKGVVGASADIHVGGNSFRSGYGDG